MRPEFTVDVVFPGAGDLILFGHVCAVDGCPRRGNSRPAGLVRAVAVPEHGERWVCRRSPRRSTVACDGVPLLTAWKRRLHPCSRRAAERSRSCEWWCSFHVEALDYGGAPGPRELRSHCAACAVGEARCELRAAGSRRCVAPAGCATRTSAPATGAATRACAIDVDSFLVLLAAAELRLVPHYDFSAFDEPLRSELRYVIQQRLDENRHALDYRRVASAAEFAPGSV